MRNVTTREGYEFWDKICAVQSYAFLLSPDGRRVVKTPDIGDWIDKHEAQVIVDHAQEEFNVVKAERDALQAELTKARELLVQWVIQSPAHLERLISETKAALGDVKKAGDKCGRCGETTACGKMLCEACCYEPMQAPNQSAPANKECSHRFMSLADDPRRCADCDAVETHDEPVVRLELVRSGASKGLHIRVWENLGNLWPGVHVLYLGPAAQPAPVAVALPERMKSRPENAAARIAYIKGWNACLDEVSRLNPIKQ